MSSPALLNLALMAGLPLLLIPGQPRAKILLALCRLPPSAHFLAFIYSVGTDLPPAILLTVYALHTPILFCFPSPSVYSEPGTTVNLFRCATAE